MTRRRAFTLIEVLIAILIIAALVAILVPTLAAAQRTARRAAVTAEFALFDRAIATFALDHGDRPPSRLVCSETGDYSRAFFDAQWPGRADRHRLRQRAAGDLRRLWPRVRLSDAPLPARDPDSPFASNPLPIPGCTWYDFNGNGRLDVEPYELTGDECLAFFLGGVPKPLGTDAGGIGLVGFASDPRNPFQPESYTDAAGTRVDPPRRAGAEFKVDRLFDADGDGVPAYADNYSGGSLPTPYAYFASAGGQYDPTDCDFATEPSGDPMPVGAFRLAGGDLASPGPNPYAAGPVLPTGAPGYATGPLKADPTFSISWLNRTTHQILSAGADRSFGPGGWWDSQATATRRPWPSAATAEVSGVAQAGDPRSGERDNLASFTPGTLD